ncbi:response regulator [Lentimicrobium sp. L6]|uniref:LytR/AlgR family response regulator transcription factor n=1 Tax=Lentimicrobium sp. L6 TaxID=2735916 RepID=UPI001557DC70|nr:response regulator [Lentimicrobium sp. L6]NPD84868.1 response regulator [Lentimicrobium sp. L6]
MKKKIKAWLIDDESDAQALVKKILVENYKEIELLGTSINIDDAFLQIKKYKPNLVFLDINLPRGSGINLLERFPIRKFEVIVISGFPENKNKLARFRDIPFLQKPYSIEDLKQLTDKALENLNKDLHKVHRYDSV